MPDPETGTPPVEANEPVVTPPETPVETPPESPTLPPETPPVEPPPEVTPEEKRDHDMKSWIGRRDAEMRTEMDRRDQTLLAEIRGMAPGAPITPAEAPDPSLDADAWFEHKLQQRVSTEQDYNSKLITVGTALIGQDEVVKANPEMANEIYQEIQSGRVPIMRNVAPEIAAQIAVTQAKSNILTNRMMKKANPLAGNTPATVPTGGITPPATPSAPAVKLPKMSDLASSAAKRWGMSDEDVAKALE